jgi:hypothetical protein
MFRDITMSEQRMNDFKKTHLSQQIPFELNVKILTTGHWPNESRDPQQVATQQGGVEAVCLPIEIKHSMSLFK